MKYLIALMFISWPEAEGAKYKIDHCYQADSDYRPTTIKILEIKNNKYVYKIWFGWQNTWGDELINKVQTIEHVYDVEVKCP
jgi:hypothetical protein